MKALKKTIFAGALAGMILVSNVTAFAAMPEGSIVIGSKGFNLDYAFNKRNAAEVNSALESNNFNFFFKDFAANWVDALGKAVDNLIIPKVSYKTVTGATETYASGDGSKISTTGTTSGTATGTTSGTATGTTSGTATGTTSGTTTGTTSGTTTGTTSGTKTEQAYATANLPTTIKSIALYSSSSAFNQKIPSTAKVDENSALMVGSLKEAFNNRGMVIAKDSYSASVFYADANTPRYNVKRTASWAGGTTLYDVPVPDFAVPDAGEGHMTIIDQSNGYQYDFWLAQKVNGQWTAGWANKISYKGDGIYPDGLSARGSGFALTAGMIWPENLKNGRIDHALVFSYPYTKTKQYVYPASKTDGTTTRADAIPMGARVQLDPTLNLDSLGLTSYEKTIARAMQEYGMILGDTSGGPIELEAVNPVSAQGNAYEGLLPNDSFTLLKKIPIDRFRVLDI